MKFLVLALCVCAASAASFNYKPYEPVKQFQGFRQPEASPFVVSKTTFNSAQFVANSPVVSAKTTYDAPKFVVTGPVVAAKPTYNAAKFVVTGPVVAAKPTYNAAKFVVTGPVVAAKPTYNAAKFVANSPVVAAKTTYDAPKFVVTAPVVAAKPTYNAAKFIATSPIVAAKPTYNVAKFVATAPVVADKNTYNADKFIAASPVVPDTVVVGAKSVYNVPQDVEYTPIVAKPVYEAPQFVASAPVVAAKTAYDNSHVLTIAPKNVYYAGKEGEADIISSDSDVSAEGYNYAYKTSNGIEAKSYGALKTVEGANVLVSEGSFQYPAPDGTFVKFEYVADENGYQPRSDLLPVAPPVPALIAKSLEYLRTHPQKQENY